MSQHPEIFFHVGLGKTGTTFLQYRVFPYFSGMEYIQRTKYKKAKEIIRRGSSERYFLSFECDQQLEDVVRDWAKDFPQTRPIIVFRRHDSWIASQFRRFLKNCHVTTFKELLDLDQNKGLFKKEELFFMPKIRLLEEVFEKQPIILLYDTMKKDPKSFIHDLATRMESSVDVDALDFSNKHSSYSDRQLTFLMRASPYINLRKKVVFQNKFIEFFRKSAVNWTRYSILFIGRFWPEKKEQNTLLDPADLERVRMSYSEDWNEILMRAKKV